MKNFKKSIVLIVVFLLFPLVATAGVPIKVYILAGQSNMVGLGQVSDAAYQNSSLKTWVNSAFINDVPFYFAGQDCGGYLLDPPPRYMTRIAPGSGLDFGPELSFARSMKNYHALTHKRVAIIKYSWGGKKLNHDPDEWNDDHTVNNDTFYYGPLGEGNQFTALFNAVCAGVAALTSHGYTPQIQGMVWMQGESDTNETDASVYEQNFTSFINRMRQCFGPQMPVVCGLISNYSEGYITHGYDPAYYTWLDYYVDTVRTAQYNVCVSDPNAAFVCTWYISRYVGGTEDPYTIIHYNAAGQIDLGNLFAQAMISLQ